VNTRNRPLRTALPLIVLITVSGWGLGAGAPGSVQERVAARDGSSIGQYLSRFDRLAMDPSAIEQLILRNGHVSIPTADGVFDVRLSPHDMRSSAYLAEEETDAGRGRLETSPRVTTYRGEVLGWPETEVRFTVRPDRFEGIIITPQEWYFVEPLLNYDPSASVTDFVVYRLSDVRPGSIGDCATSLTERIAEAEEWSGPAVRAAGSGVQVADVATEADYEYVSAMGGASAANSAILEILNQVDGIYRSQLSLSLHVVYQHAWASTSDPYISTSPATMLGEFRSYFAANPPAVGYDLAHMWTGKDMDGSTVGIAYLGVICNSHAYAYGVSQRLSSAPAKYIVTAHEIGHNFGATHTDQASPIPADCGNTIMNSSVGTGTTFCPFSQNEIASHVASSSGCLVTESSSSCDINGDGQVNVVDTQLLINVVLGAACSGSCDVNGDGRVDVLDLQKIVNVILGLATCP
jgi:hypothetical protein